MLDVLRMLRQLDDIMPAPRPNNGLLPEVGLRRRSRKDDETGGFKHVQGLNQPKSSIGKSLAGVRRPVIRT